MLSLRQEKPLNRRNKQEDLEFEIRFFEGVARRDRDCVEALQILGDAYTKSGQWEKGLTIDKRLAHLCPDNPLVFYNLACSYSVMGRIDSALAALEKAVKLGYDDVQWLNKDPDLENVRKDGRFASIQKSVPDKPRD